MFINIYLTQTEARQWNHTTDGLHFLHLTSSISPQPSSLSRQDIDRIRLARRQQIAFSDMEPPKVEPFEFFIIPLSTDAKVEPLAVGYYDPNTGQMDVAPWSDVKQLLKDGHQ